MIKKYFLSLTVISIIGFFLAVLVVISGNKNPEMREPILPIPASPYQSYVSGAAIVEPISGEIKIGTPYSRVISSVYVKIGSKVKAGDPLFTLKHPDLEAEYLIKRVMVDQAEANYKKLLMMPRPEDVISAEIALRISQIAFDQAKNELNISNDLLAAQIVSQEEVKRKDFALQQTHEKVLQMETRLKQLKAGTWPPDLEIASTQLTLAKTQLENARKAIEEMTIRSPIRGEILLLKANSGEITPMGVPLLVIGNTDEMRVRIEIDENDAWKIKPDAPAVGYAMSNNKKIQIPLKFIRIDPVITPKKVLTGENFERTDTRVLNVLYRFKPEDPGIYVGQQMDVFIEVPAPKETPGQK